MSVTVTATIIQDRFLKLKDQLKKNTQLKKLEQKIFYMANLRFGLLKLTT